MKYFAAILIVSFIGACVQGHVVNKREVECASYCPTVYDPICASNGTHHIQFGNKCHLGIANCRAGNENTEAFVSTAFDWCTSEYVANLRKVHKSIENVREECLRPCPFMYAPLCVSNGKYRGEVSCACELETFNCALGLDDPSDTTSERMSLFRVLKPGKC